jgi:hypothetical protein
MVNGLIFSRRLPLRPLDQWATSTLLGMRRTPAIRDVCALARTTNLVALILKRAGHSSSALELLNESLRRLADIPRNLRPGELSIVALQTWTNILRLEFQEAAPHALIAELYRLNHAFTSKSQYMAGPYEIGGTDWQEMANADSSTAIELSDLLVHHHAVAHLVRHSPDRCRRVLDQLDGMKLPMSGLALEARINCAISLDDIATAMHSIEEISNLGPLGAVSASFYTTVIAYRNSSHGSCESVRDRLRGLCQVIRESIQYDAQGVATAWRNAVSFDEAIGGVLRRSELTVACSCLAFAANDHMMLRYVTTQDPWSTIVAQTLTSYSTMSESIRVELTDEAHLQWAEVLGR